MPTDSPDIFISYARADASGDATRLDLELRQLGLKVWRDVRDIDPAQDFTAEIEKAIEASRYVVACISTDVKREDSFVRREISYALIIGIPVYVARFADVPPPIQVINNTRADFFAGWDSALNELWKWISSKNLKGNPPTTMIDPYRSYIESMYREVVETLKISVFSDDIITLRAIESVGDVPRKAYQFNPKYLSYVLRENLEGENIPPTEFSSLHNAYENAVCDGRVLLLGEPGAGKTTSLLAFARDAAAARLSDASQPLPIFARISGWDSNAQTPLTDWLSKQNVGIEADTLRKLIEDGEVLLLLDGLDELGSSRLIDPEKPEGDQYDPRERFLKQLPVIGRVILSSRFRDYRQIGKQAALRCAVRLERLDNAQMEAFLNDSKELWNIVQADVDLKEALRTPLLLALFRIGFEAAPKEARSLRDLSKGDLNDRIWEKFIEQRWEFEQARTPNVPLPYTANNLKLRLGQAIVNALTNPLREDYTRILLGDISPIADAAEIIELAKRLNIIRRTTLSINFDREEVTWTNHLLHLRLRDALAFPVALAQLTNQYGYGRASAAEALGKLGDVRAIDPLITVALHDSDYYIRGKAMEALTKLSYGSAGKRLISTLTHPSIGVRKKSAYILGKLSDANAVEALIHVFYTNNNGVVRKSALVALSRIGDKRAVETYIVALHDRNREVRRSAARALGYSQDARAVEPLIIALQDPNKFVRRMVIRALRSFENNSLAQSALKAYRKSKSSSQNLN